MIDTFHFNSENTANIFASFTNIPGCSKVVSITHSGILDSRTIKKFDNSVLRLGFIGSEAPYKGLPILRRVIKDLNNMGLSQRVELNVYGGRTGNDLELNNVFFKGRFNNAQMKVVYDTMDLLIVPSVCYETFSLITLEALQYGVPVLVSDNVGAKDVVRDFAPQFIFRDEVELKRLLNIIIQDRTELISYNKAICKAPWKWSMKQHTNDIIKYIYE